MTSERASTTEITALTYQSTRHHVCENCTLQIKIPYDRLPVQHVNKMITNEHTQVHANGCTSCHSQVGSIQKLHYYRLDYVHLLLAGQSWDWTLAVARFSTPIQTSPGTHPASYTEDTFSFPGIKQLGWGINHSCFYSTPCVPSSRLQAELHFYPYIYSRPS